MSLEKGQIYWHAYDDHLKEMVQEMMTLDRLKDVTLVCDDKIQFMAHKIVLSACSSVFKSIIYDLPTNNSVIYLRGIEHQEMESILQFMYLGVATSNEARLDKFLAVAKNLEIKGVSQNVEFADSGIDDEEHVDLEPPKNSDDRKQDDDCNYEIKRELEELQSKVSLDGNGYLINSNLQNLKENNFCKYCQSQFSQPSALKRHIKGIHEGVKFECHQCHRTYTQKYMLKEHIEAVHEGMTRRCDLCNLQFNQHSSLKRHIKEKH